MVNTRTVGETRRRWLLAGTAAAGALLGMFVVGMAVPDAGPWSLLGGCALVGATAVSLVAVPPTGGRGIRTGRK